MADSLYLALFQQLTQADRYFPLSAVRVILLEPGATLLIFQTAAFVTVGSNPVGSIV